MARLGVALVAALAIGLGACGGSDSTTPPPKHQRSENADELPKLPDGWKPHVNQAGGFALGLPRGWEPADHGGTTQVRSYDRLVVLTISADRTEEALGVPLGEFATVTAGELPGLKDSSTPSDPKPFKHRYDAVETSLTAKSAKTGVRERISVIVIRRDHLALFTADVFASATAQAEDATRLARQAIATLRSQPPSS
ncbi:MAG: hypothetical protein ACJ75R_00230 [Solirubrobacterales bacterium]